MSVFSEQVDCYEPRRYRAAASGCSAGRTGSDVLDHYPSLHMLEGMNLQFHIFHVL